MQAVLSLFVCLITASVALKGKGNNLRWINEFDQNLNFQCVNDESISMITSVHENKHEDRRWAFRCKKTFSNSGNCNWSGYINNFDEEFEFTCPFGSVLNGMSSYHDNKKEDRRWNFLCCLGEVQVVKKCKWSDYVNEFDEYLSWEAPTNHYLVGASSYHNNKREDRRWRYHSCEKN
ncbi:hemagglutinin amebocyte aggregation factor-like [Pelobates cultripes]|uniref:Hemagglutinin amebocyte aggregation factor-like n=1 Tax=Pelobates cultripes TaxID=61616 RepID=A0AAD1RR53_PELCU|nr:hemagglutinin amebocyte aggregation factor-like [Pelobates cultripes]